MPITASTLETARKAILAGKPNPLKPGRIADGRNLYLSIAKTGAMSWVFIQMTNGKSREIGLGSFTGDGRAFRLSLADARIEADAMRLKLRDGIDPIAERKAARVAAKIDGVTFAEMVKDTIELQRAAGGWKVKDGVSEQAEQWAASLTLHASSLLPRKIGTVTEADVYAVFRPIWKKIGVTAERVRDRMEKVFEVAIDRGAHKGPNPARYNSAFQSNVGSRPSAKNGKGKKKQPSLPHAKVPAAIAQLWTDARMGAKASIFCTLTWTRTDEARLMKRSEVDFANKLWTVPAERMKVQTENDRGGDHLVPLSDAAIAVLRSIPEVPGNPYVFAGQKAGKPIGETALNDMITLGRAEGGLLELKGQATQHGMRASGRTWAREYRDERGHKFDQAAAEMCLAHVVGNKTEKAYDRAELLVERREIMDAWGAYCRPGAKLALVA